MYSYHPTVVIMMKFNETSTLQNLLLAENLQTKWSN